MSTWTTPATFTAASVLTAAQLNSEIRDKMNYLKGFADLITNSTTADTGNATYLNIARSATTGGILYGRVTGEPSTRFDIRADGRIEWADGTNATDVVLYRAAADVLQTDDHLFVGPAGLIMNKNGYFEITEITAPGTGALNTARLYCDDNGSGKTRLNVVFTSGAVQVLATQP